MRPTPSASPRAVRDVEKLLDAAREALCSLLPSHFFGELAKMLLVQFECDFAAVGVVEDEQVIFRAACGLGGARVSDARHAPLWSVPLGSGVAGRAAQQLEARLVANPQAEASAVELAPTESVGSMIVVPLVHRAGAIGVLELASRRANAFVPSDLRALRMVASVATPALHSALAYDEERRRSRQLRLVNEISRLVASSLDRDEVFSLTCEAVLDALGASLVEVLLLDRTETRLQHSARATRDDEPEPSQAPLPSVAVDAGDSLPAEVFRSGESIVIDDIARRDGYRRVFGEARSILCAPLRLMGRVIGVIVVTAPEADQFAKHDVRLVENAGGLLAQALDNAMLFDAQRRRWQQLLLINEVARVCTTSIDLDEVLERVARQVHDRFGFYAVSVMLRQDDEIVVQALACDGECQIAIGDREPIGKGIAGTAAQTGHTVQIDERSQFGGSRAAGPDINSALCVPLTRGSNVIGAIQVQSLERADFGADDRLMLEALAESVAGSIANARAVAQTRQLREDLTRMIVHDLRNPVQSVLMSLEEVERTELPTSTREAVAGSVACARDLLEMVNSLLDVARFEAGRVTIKRYPAAINDHIRGVLRRVSAIARAKQVPIKTELASDLPVLRLDRDLTTRMLDNLISNAIKFTPPGAPITITSRLEERGAPLHGIAAPCVVLTVADRGEGIPAEYHEKIFEKFGQVESRKAGLTMSAGLGLALCRYVVECHGGRIWVESRPNAGATFYVALPTV